MHNVQVCSAFLTPITCDASKVHILSVVCYAYPSHVPARLCAGLVPAVALARALQSHGIRAHIRIIDPSPIASYCNGWDTDQRCAQEAVLTFCTHNAVACTIYRAKSVSTDSLTVMHTLGDSLSMASSAEVASMVERICTSGERHGGSRGRQNALLYMAAHPFSWLDMQNDLFWPERFPSTEYACINIVSKAEERYSLIRSYLCNTHPELRSQNRPHDVTMSICGTPSYVPLPEEPTLDDMRTHGHQWCLERYASLRSKSENHRRAHRDFMHFMDYLPARIAAH